MISLTMNRAAAFVVPISFSTSSIPSATCHSSAEISLNMMDVAVGTSLSDTVGTVLSSGNGFLVAETEAWVQPTITLLGPFLNFMSFAMLCRVVASWYPAETKLNEFPWLIVAWPSEPLLRLAKGKIPPAFGVDITPVFWLAIFTFLNEILLGQQGLLVMKVKYGI